MREAKPIERPLFVPLYGEHFDNFARGTKTAEYRQYGARWNEQTCRVGRRVVLSRGYSGPRLIAKIVAVHLVPARDIPKDVRGLFPVGAKLIRIVLSPPQKMLDQPEPRPSRKTPRTDGRRRP
jgi:hypothetical protein